MDASQSDLPKNASENTPTKRRRISLAFALLLASLLLFASGVFTMLSPAMFTGGVYGLGRNYAAMDSQPRGINLFLDRPVGPAMPDGLYCCHSSQESFADLVFDAAHAILTPDHLI